MGYIELQNKIKKLTTTINSLIINANTTNAKVDLTVNEVKRIGRLTRTWNSDMYEYAELMDAMERNHDKMKKSIVKTKAKIIQLHEAVQWQNTRLNSIETKLTQHTIAIRRLTNKQQQLASQDSCTTTERSFNDDTHNINNENQQTLSQMDISGEW
jgi:uncharacterized coiled-coil DUF342 family protein